MGTTVKAKVFKTTKPDIYRVKMYIIHERVSSTVATKITLNAKQIYKTSLKIRDHQIIDLVEDLEKRWRFFISELGTAADTMTIQELVAYLKAEEKKTFTVEEPEKPFTLDFIEYAKEIAAKKSEGTKRGYLTSINALERFMNGKTLDVNQITVKFLEDFEEYIKNEPVLNYSPKTKKLTKSDKSKAEGRAISSYLANLRHIHNQARKEHNDEDMEQINIPRSPFNKYTVNKPPRRKKRAIDIKLIQQIIDLPNLERTDGSVVDLTRRDLARDCYILSLALAGMNAADLYDCPAQNFGKKTKVIHYKRKKTRTRREDEAEMHIRVEPFLWPLLEKYKDPKGEKLFCFCRHYSTPNGFNVALRNGLLQIKKAIKTKKHFTFYSARHSWATIGRSKKVNIDKYTIHEGLNHIDDDMKITDGYVDRDYSLIWEANAKILQQFDWQPLIQREKTPK